MNGATIPPVSLCAKKYKAKHVPSLTQKIWGDIRAAVKDSTLFGVAIDAGVIRIHHRHVLASVLYVDGKSWTLPLIYNKDAGPFNGKTQATHLWDMLQQNLETAQACKLSYVIIDGCGTNPVMANQLNAEIGSTIAEVGSIGEHDWDHIIATLIERAERIIIKIPCLGHFLHNVAKSALLPYWEGSAKTTVFGGCTRWITDMFDSVAYIKTHLRAIMLYVAESTKHSEVSESMVQLGKVLLQHKTEEIIAAADKFLEEGKFFRDCLQKFSNKTDKVCIADAQDTMDDLWEHCRNRPEYQRAYEHHMDRVAKKDGCHMEYFTIVRWLDPKYLTLTKERPPLNIFHGLFRSEKIDFLESDVQHFFATTDFFVHDGNSQPQIENHTALKWWLHYGQRKFPRMARSAIAFLTPPAVVNECDSFFSVMDASFTSRQARLGTDTVRNILFIARNMPEISYHDDL